MMFTSPPLVLEDRYNNRFYKRAVIIILLVVAAMELMGLVDLLRHWPVTARERWESVVGAVGMPLVFFGLLALSRWSRPRQVLRLDRRGITRAWVGRPKRQRYHMPWASIERVRLGGVTLRFASGTAQIGVARSAFGHARWLAFCDRVRQILEPEFDLTTPTPAQLKQQWVDNRTPLTYVLDLGLATGLGLAGVAIVFMTLSLASLIQPRWISHFGLSLVVLSIIIVAHFCDRRRQSRDEANWRTRRTVT